MKVLIVAAHPDDEVLGCGGTAARWSREGHDLSIAILGEGATSRYRRREEADRGLVEALKDRSREAARLLGAGSLFHYELPDNRFDSVPLLEVIQIVEELVERLQPEIVYTHHGGDLNVDHRRVHQAVLTATRPRRGHSVREVCAFEIPSSTDWAFQRFEPAFRASVFVDISTTLDLKLKALSLYDAELRAFPHPRSLEAVQAAARRWGSVAGFAAAEAFELIRSLR
jgi:LmbE family N-acetylglucosaminyl deacetylase